jgi:hypothetical protein
VVSATVLEIADGAIRQIRAMVNPDKLRHLGSVGECRGLDAGGTRVGTHRSPRDR